jgi:hypothetical protein
MMKKSDTLKTLVVGAVLAGAAAGANAATVLISKLDQPIRATTVIPTDECWAAQSFVADGSEYRLKMANVPPVNLTGTPTIIAELRAGDITSLGATLTTFTLSEALKWSRSKFA